MHRSMPKQTYAKKAEVPLEQSCRQTRAMTRKRKLSFASATVNGGDTKVLKTPNYMNERTTKIESKKVILKKGFLKKEPAIEKQNQWTNEEDNHLLSLAKAAFGKKGWEDRSQSEWKEIAEEMATGRNGKQCRDRWNSHLRPGIKKGEWTEKEDDLIKELHGAFGPKWSAIAQLLHGRSENDIKNRWYTMSRQQGHPKERSDEDTMTSDSLNSSSRHMQNNPKNIGTKDG